MKLSYKHTLASSYAGYITQAEVNNFLPLIFAVLSTDFGIGLSQIATLIVLNFGVQIITDLLAAPIADRLGLRTGAVLAHVISALGLSSLGVLPFIIDPPFAGLVISVVLSAVGSGLCEVIVSPVVESLPLKRKAAHMSLLHSFYSWGHVLVVLCSTLFFVTVGIGHWRVLAILWAVIPAVNAIMFTKVPICPLMDERSEKIPLNELVRAPYFLILFVIMLCAGASEICMAQWASYFAERGLGVSKTLGDLLGPCSFALLMGLSRVFFARFEKKIDLKLAIMYSSLLCAACYALTALANSPILSLLGCALCGLSVGLMWPGVISLCAAKFKRAGGTMFALLAFAGDIGCTSGPWLVSVIAKQSDLKSGLLVMVIFPVTMMIGCVLLKRRCFKDVR